MPINPHNSPHLQKLHHARINQTVSKHIPLKQICKLFTPGYTFRQLSDTHGIIKINNEFFINANIKSIRKKGNKMRLISRLDWVHYDAADLAMAIETNTVELYYAQQLGDPRSDPNCWKNTVEELTLKSHYANRVNRPLDSLDNL